MASTPLLVPSWYLNKHHSLFEPGVWPLQRRDDWFRETHHNAVIFIVDPSQSTDMWVVGGIWPRPGFDNINALRGGK